MKALTAKDRVTTLAREVLGPILAAKGFGRNGRVFWRNSAQACQVIALKLNWAGTRTESIFDVFLGVFWHDVEKLLKNPSARKIPPPEHQCTFRVDLGWTTPTRLQKSWKVNLETDLSELGDELLSDLIRFGLPWLEYRSKLKHVLGKTRFLKPTGNGLYRSHELQSADTKVVFLARRGKKSEAKKELMSWIANGHAKSARSLAKLLGISLSKS